MTKEIRKEIVLNAVRWTTNILVEVLSNHAAAVSDAGRKELSEAVQALNRAESEFRK